MDRLKSCWRTLRRSPQAKTLQPLVWLIIVCLLPALGSGALPLGVRAEEETTISIVPPAQEILIGEISTTDVRVENVDNLYGASFEITFDSDVMEVMDEDPIKPGVQIQPGDFLSLDWLLDNSVDNDSGIITYAVSQWSPSEPRTGSGVLATITWRGKAVGTGSIRFADVQLGAQGGVSIPADPQHGEITVQDSSPAPTFDHFLFLPLGFKFGCVGADPRS